MRQVLLCTYANDYMGYVTTNEEYQEQCYEGGHTIFGQWTLAAFQTRLTTLARRHSGHRERWRAMIGNPGEKGRRLDIASATSPALGSGSRTGCAVAWPE